MRKSEVESQRTIVEALAKAGWAVQSMATVNLTASRGVAVEEVALTTGEADYLLFVDGCAAGFSLAMIDGTTIRAHQHAAGANKGAPPPRSAAAAAGGEASCT
jgi:hypothetical protein